MDYERNQLGQAATLYYPDTTSKSGMQMGFSYTSHGKVDTITRSPDTLVDYDYAGSNVLSRSYPDPTNDVHYTLAYDSFGRVTRHHTYQDGTPDVEIADFNYTYDDNGNILSQEFAHRTSSPDNIYTYDNLDRLTEADYLVEVLTEDEQFTYDLLGNRLSVNDRAGSNVAYTHNIANEYATIGGQTVSHDAPGNLSVDVNGYKYFYDYENRLEKVKNSSDALKAEYTYDALGRRIEKYDVAAGTRTRYYYDGWRVLSETNAAGTILREYVYGNYLDEVLVMVDSSGDDHYYAHNHLFSPVALLDNTGAVEERYEYNAYGKVTAMTDKGTGTWWDGDETTASVSAQGNPYTFTGQRLDALDNNSLLVMYYKNRYYDTDTGRFLQRDPLGVVPNSQKPNRFSPRGQYRDGMNTYEAFRSNSILNTDPFGLKAEDGEVCCKIRETHSKIVEVGRRRPGRRDPGYGDLATIPVYGTKKWSTCSQTTIPNPNGKSPASACRCHFPEPIKIDGAKAGKCCRCKVTMISSPLPLLGHWGIIVECDNKEFNFNTQLSPNKIGQGLFSPLEQDNLVVDEISTYWGITLTMNSCTISCEHALSWRDILRDETRKFSVWGAIAGGETCAGYANGTFSAMCDDDCP